MRVIIIVVVVPVFVVPPHVPSPPMSCLVILALGKRIISNQKGCGTNVASVNAVCIGSGEMGRRVAVVSGIKKSVDLLIGGLGIARATSRCVNADVLLTTARKEIIKTTRREIMVFSWSRMYCNS